jgi:HrpA-like RNA helicase
MVKELPIMVAKQKIIEEIKADKIVIIIGDTGSGKSTKVSQFLIKLLNFANSKIGCTQPRRIAAMSVAKYVAYDTNTKLGDFVGYTVRFENNCKKNTKIKFYILF